MQRCTVILKTLKTKTCRLQAGIDKFVNWTDKWQVDSERSSWCCVLGECLSMAEEALLICCARLGRWRRFLWTLCSSVSGYCLQTRTWRSSAVSHCRYPSRLLERWRTCRYRRQTWLARYHCQVLAGGQMIRYDTVDLRALKSWRDGQLNLAHDTVTMKDGALYITLAMMSWVPKCFLRTWCNVNDREFWN